MIEGKWFAPGADLSEVLPLRESAFGRGADALDSEAWNVIVYYNGENAATGRIWWREGAFWIGDITVRADLRGQKLGDLALRLLLFKAETHSARLIRALSPESLTGFFTRLNFRADGPCENGVQPLLLKGEELCLDTCQGCKKNCPNRC